jgi:hypothetical protein
MPQIDAPPTLRVPLFDVLDALGYGEHGNQRHYNTGTLFWSLTRLFGCYYRIVTVLKLPRDERPFLDADIESFIIRFRIVLNDLAYVVRQLIPNNARGVKSPDGPTHPKNREMSIFKLSASLKQAAPLYPELSAALEQAQPWMERLKHDRDNVVHYKSKANVFEGDPLAFAFTNAAQTERTEKVPGGGERLLLEPIDFFVNAQMLSLHSFMHHELVAAIRAHACRAGMKSVAAGWDSRITCNGVSEFKEANKIEA